MGEWVFWAVNALDTEPEIILKLIFFCGADLVDKLVVRSAVD